MTVPLLYFLGRLDGFGSQRMPIAVATSMLMALVLSSVATLANWRADGFPPGVVAALGLGSVAGGVVGTSLVTQLPGPALARIFAGFLLLNGLAMLFGREKDAKAHAQSPPKVRVWFPLLGALAGLVASLTGTGGGVILVPALQRLSDFPIKIAISTSSATIVLTAAAAVGTHALSGCRTGPAGTTQALLHWPYAIPLVLGAIPGAAFGSWVLRHSRSRHIELAFALLQFGIAVQLFLSAE